MKKRSVVRLLLGGHQVKSAEREGSHEALRNVVLFFFFVGVCVCVSWERECAARRGRCWLLQLWLVHVPWGT